VRTSRARRIVVLLAACAVPAALFGVGYAITGAGAQTAPQTPPDTSASGDTIVRASGPDALAAQQNFYAKLPDRIAIPDANGKRVGWVDKAALVPPSAKGDFDPKTESAWEDNLIPVRDDNGVLVGYVLMGYGYVDRATAESPAFDRSALRSQRAATAPLPPAAVDATPGAGN
jgi:hypothetical protein